MRAAVKHYLIAEMGYTRAEVAEALPKAKGLPGRIRDALDASQLAQYHAAVNEIDRLLHTRKALGQLVFKAVELLFNVGSVCNTGMIVRFQGQEVVRCDPIDLHVHCLEHNNEIFVYAQTGNHQRRKARCPKGKSTITR